MMFLYGDAVVLGVGSKRAEAAHSLISQKEWRAALCNDPVSKLGVITKPITIRWDMMNMGFSFVILELRLIQQLMS